MIPVEKNKVYDCLVVSMTHDGNGVAKIDNFPIFIKNTLPGESVNVKIISIKKKFAIGKLMEIYKQNEFRIEPKCSIYKECGGCNLQHLSYKGQLSIKTQTVKDALKRIGNLDVKVNDCIGMDNPWKYRNKTQVPFGVKDNEIVAGFYKRNTHDIINMDSCDIQDEVTDEIINYIKYLSKKYYIKPYNEVSHSGFLRHVIVRKGYVTNEYMVTLVTKEENFPNRNNVVRELVNKFLMIKSIIQNINNKKTNTIIGNNQLVLYGNEYIYDYIGDVKYAISSRSFYQVNPVQTKRLYDEVKRFAKLTGKETIIDAYCGIGTIGLYLSKEANALYGVEVVDDAINDARLNAKLNGFDNAYYEVGEAENVIKKWKDENINVDIIIVDPPRKGCDSKLLETIIEMKIPRMIYVSCDPATLARDLKILNNGNYNIEEVQPVDMFPHTMHVESIVLLKRKEADN